MLSGQGQRTDSEDRGIDVGCAGLERGEGVGNGASCDRQTSWATPMYPWSTHPCRRGSGTQCPSARRLRYLQPCPKLTSIDDKLTTQGSHQIIHHPRGRTADCVSNAHAVHAGTINSLVQSEEVHEVGAEGVLR